MGSVGVWFVAINAVVAAIAFLSRARLASPRRGGVTRRASSLALQRLRSFFIFSYPSACLSFLLPDAAVAATSRDAQQEPVVTAPINKSPTTPRALVVLPSPPAAVHAPTAGEEDDEEGDPNAMSMDEAYALVMAARQRPEHEREEEARRSEVDAKAEEFIQGVQEDLRQQRLDSIFNYTQMLKQRALGRGRR